VGWRRGDGGCNKLNTHYGRKKRKGKGAVGLLLGGRIWKWEWEYEYGDTVEVEVNALFVPYQVRMDGESSLFRGMPWILRV
jgi:hypothetical protein